MQYTKLEEQVARGILATRLESVGDDKWYIDDYWTNFVDEARAAIAICYSVFYSDHPDLIPTVCVRTTGHDGPCNGFPRPVCAGYNNWLKSLKENAHGH